MNKKIILAVMITMFCLTGCSNAQILDTNWTFTYADIDGVGTVEVSTWKDFENSDSIQITAKDGTTYYTHLSKVILRNK